MRRTLKLTARVVTTSSQRAHHKHDLAIDLVSTVPPNGRNILVITQRCRKPHCHYERFLIMVLPGGEN
jgi:hypothetical protein